MGYVYVKKTSTRQTSRIKKIDKKLKRQISIAMFGLGVTALLSVIYPIVHFQLQYSRNFKQILSPLSNGFYNKNINNSIDYTQLSNWFAVDNNTNSTHSKELLSNSENKSYLLSIPKLGIKDALVEIGSMDLKKSIIHYPQTALPGQLGNTVVFGHSVLPQFFNPKSYLTIFSTLYKVSVGDKIIIKYDKVDYTYTIDDIYEIKATDFSVLDQRYDGKYLSIVTCSPPGTYLRRLVVKASITQ